MTQDDQNYDENYCNKIDEKDESTYEFILAKLNDANSFPNFNFNLYDESSRKQERFFELDGVKYKFVNPHEKKDADSPKKKPLSSTSMKILENTFFQQTSQPQRAITSKLVQELHAKKSI